LPESRSLMRKGLKRGHAFSGPIGASTAGERHGRSEVVVEECIPLNGEGVAVWRVGVPSLGQVEGRLFPGDGPRYYFVAGGEMIVDGKVLGQGSVVFVHDEGDFMIATGEAGLDVIILQFPIAATAGKPDH